MDLELKSRALQEIFKSCDIIIASGKKGIAEKVGKELGISLYDMGVSLEEAKSLFEIAGKSVFEDDSDNEIYVFEGGGTVCYDSKDSHYVPIDSE